MNMYELNKICGAVLGAGLLLMVVNEVGNALVHPSMPAKAAIAVPEEDAATDADKAGAAKDDAAGGMDLAALLAIADADKGAKVAKKCAACHTFDKGGKNKVGPALYGVLGRALGGGADFSYSGAMTDKGGQWTYAELDAFLSDPKGYLPGTKMAFKGLSKGADRANLIAYMRQNHDSPPALPAK